MTTYGRDKKTGISTNMAKVYKKHGEYGLGRRIPEWLKAVERKIMVNTQWDIVEEGREINIWFNDKTEDWFFKSSRC